MKVTREVVKDLLPKYFSGEASEDTRRMVEEYFRQDPSFERAARAANSPETLSGASARAENRQRERGNLVWQCGSQRGWLGVAVFFAVWPLVPLVSSELGVWLGAPQTWAGRIVDWSIAAYFLLMYIIRPANWNLPLVWTIFVSLGEAALILDRLGIIRDGSPRATNLEVIGIGALAAFFWIWYFGWRGRTA